MVTASSSECRCRNRYWRGRECVAKLTDRRVTPDRGAPRSAQPSLVTRIKRDKRLSASTAWGMSGGRTRRSANFAMHSSATAPGSRRHSHIALATAHPPATATRHNATETTTFTTASAQRPSCASSSVCRLNAETDSLVAAGKELVQRALDDRAARGRNALLDLEFLVPERDRRVRGRRESRQGRRPSALDVPSGRQTPPAASSSPRRCSRSRTSRRR